MNKSEIIERIKSKKAFISDMDGVIYHGNRLLPGVPEFVDWLKRENKKFLFLTNSSERTPKELQEKMRRLGIDVEADVFYTSALAAANFLASQKPKGTAYIIGEAGLISAAPPLTRAAFLFCCTSCRITPQCLTKNLSGVLIRISHARCRKRRSLRRVCKRPRSNDRAAVNRSGCMCLPARSP